MQPKLNVLILAAGNTQYQDSDGGYPLYLAEFNGKPVIEQCFNSCQQASPSTIIMACREQDVSHYHLGNVPALLNQNARMLSIRGETKGAACTALLASPSIDNDDNLLIVSVNEILDLNYGEAVQAFRDAKLDAGVVTFPSIHPRYSYVKVDPQTDLLIETAEKHPISQDAAASFYWFAKGSDFVAAAQEMIRKDANVGGLFYICPSLNQLILRQKRVGRLQIERNQYHPLKTDRQITNFEHSHERSVTK